MIKGKQIQNSSITQSKLNLVTLTATTALATVEYVNLSGSTKKTWSISNYNMTAYPTTTNGDLACTTPILETPYSIITVKLNGLDINVGGTSSIYDAYFSPDSGATVRAMGEEQQGDYLYWNTTSAGYNLETTDILDFIYLTTYVPQPTLELIFQTNQTPNKSVLLILK